MTTVLAYTSPARGHLFPVVPVLLELAARGCDVRVRTLQGHVEQLCALGLRTAPLHPDVEAVANDDWTAKGVRQSQSRAMAAFGRRAPHEVADLRGALGDTGADLLLVDSMAFGAMAAAEAPGLPWASWLPYPAWVPRQGVPPYGPGLPLLQGLPGRARDAVVRRVAAGPGQRLTEAVNAGRAAAGLPPVSGPGDVLLRPPATLALTIDAFEHPGPWPDSFTLVGPLAWEPPDWLDDDSRPLVLVTTSSEFQNDARLAVTAVEALRDRSDVRVVITVPTGWIERPVDVPEHVHLEDFVPHGPLLARAAAVVCHGGAGITFKALAAGVPVVAVPFGRDQLEVAQRLVASAGGVVLPSRRLSARRLSEAVAAAERLRPRAGELAASADRAGGAALAADVVLGLTVARRSCASGSTP